ncbi:hypothetical protein N431DRAFT_524214 [Stipitochalara longipes BDJ]|nr:hypothetical protein N431DRAFT_524214 [Stipitochalara longipes BDJ]
MEDAICPDEQAFKAMYERGYRTWSSLHEMTVDKGETQLPWWKSLFQLNYPAFPGDLNLDASSSNIVLAKGKSRWKTSQESCDLPSFDQDFFVPIASDRPIIINISEQPNSATAFFPCFIQDDDHVALLVLAWTYILSARWAEIIPGASSLEYTEFEAKWDIETNSAEKASTDPKMVVVDLGDVDDGAARWWAAIISLEGGWKASISSDKGHILNSPWYTKPKSEHRFSLSRSTKFQQLPTQYLAASFSTALRYLSSYCELHDIFEQMHAALAATLLLPVAKFDNRNIRLPIPRIRWKNNTTKNRIWTAPLWSENLNQLDRLLTMSCNAVGVKALLNSIFFEPGVKCNIYEAWLQRTFTFLNSDIIQDQNSLLRVLIRRDPSLGFLWLGAFVIGAQARALQEARVGWWKIDLHVAAWTGTLMSFIQEPVSPLLPQAQQVLRADEGRLMYLSHDLPYTVPPLFPFAPFGSTALTDTNLDVRLHAKCGTSHFLEYKSLTWRCRSPEGVSTLLCIPTLRGKVGSPAGVTGPVNYDKLDNEDDDCSQMVTHNVFTWLRDEGFPVAERAIREHEWIDNLDSDDDEPITGDALSTVGGNLHGWLLKTLTKRSNSI